MNLLLIGCLALILICAWIGYKRGFVKVLFSLVSFIVVMVLVGIISPIIGDVLQNQTSLPDTISEKCVEFVREWNVAGEMNTLEGRTALVDGYQFPEAIKNYLKTDEGFGILETDFTTYVSDKIAGLIIDAIAYVTAFAIVWIVLRIVANVLDVVAKLPVLRSVNKVGGLAAGGAQGLVIIWIAFLIITICCTTQWGSRCMEMIAESKILTYIYDKNVILNFIPGL